MIQRGYVSSLARIRGVDVVHWNPRYRFTVAGRTVVQLPVRANNFGDLLGPIIVERLAGSSTKPETLQQAAPRLTAVGSILHFAQEGDTVWGTGVNGKVDPTRHRFGSLDVRAVRGPRTAQYLDSRGVSVDVPYGDPALLVPDLFPELQKASQEKRYRRTVIPNLNDLSKFMRHPDLLNPRTNVWACLRRIVQSELVVGTSLHAMIIAESFGIDFVLLESHSESSFKFHDYAEGTGRRLVEPAKSLDSVLSAPRMEPLLYSARALRDSFPHDLWRAVS